MNNQQHEALIMADHAKAVWDAIVGSFFENKKEHLLNSFQRCTPKDIDDIITINLTLSILNDLKNEIDAYIETGRMVQMDLNFEEQN